MGHFGSRPYFIVGSEKERQEQPVEVPKNIPMLQNSQNKKKTQFKMVRNF